VTPYIGLKAEPIAAASKIAMQRAGRVVLALRWTAGTEGIGERMSAGHDAAHGTRGILVRELRQILVRCGMRLCR
jgi:hypothetical protein